MLEIGTSEFYQAGATIFNLVFLPKVNLSTG